MMLGTINTQDKAISELQAGKTALNAHVCCNWTAIVGTRARVAIWSYANKEAFEAGAQAGMMAPAVIVIGNDRPANLIDHSDPANDPFYARCEEILVSNGSNYDGFTIVETPIV